MRKIQRVAVVAVAIAGLSTFGAGVSFAGGHEKEKDATDITAVAVSQSNAVASWDAPNGDKHGDKGGHSTPEQAVDQFALPYISR
ncbi:hypothetical protein QQY66_04500 [Streptomyces sp. DG2A-72]|uniref:hypothetical protein n=1 Tax=Streptomyces sp. DG2A-72 TaxID=3051386 RepID=UPI00265C5E76|nr:hypothetical protein [Streptomyces sp. DG2A-72]MDO0930973.1 hypothetical protein [Streptomyces sp. DG2A-72]